MNTQNDAPQYEGQIRVTPSPFGRHAFLVDVAFQECRGQFSWAQVPPQSAQYGQYLAEFRRQQKLARLLHRRVRQIIRKAADSLTPQVMAHLKASSDLWSVYVRLRAHAVEFSDAGLRSSYWNVIDALGFYLDATTAQWKYLTVEGRQRLINWSEEMASSRV